MAGPVEQKPEGTTRFMVGEFPDRSFDIAWWQKQGDEAIFAAAWEMIELAGEMKHGRRPEFQRTVTCLKHDAKPDPGAKSGSGVRLR